ncbi:OmpA family protein [Aquabacterium sp.]|uniref:OmpA family protein n=1 Tax=Aquabacterium sp. TaxID=1872578 RepID=UPI0025BF799F|nr:OmpA family protein [Aquabacterium sp.]
MKRWTISLALCAVLALSACASKNAPEKPPVKLAVTQVSRGVLIWLPDNVMFDFGAHTLSPEAEGYLRLVADLAMTRTTESLALEGHTDSVGGADYNQALSLKRADAVALALSQLGVPVERMKTAGFGLTRPLAPNDSDVGRRLNRRVEIIVLNETVAHLSQGEPANRFEDAFDKLKAELGDRVNAGGFR